MKLADKIIETHDCVQEAPLRSNESMGSSDRINVRLEDGHEVGVHCSMDIYKGYGGDGQKVDDVDKQAMVRNLLKPELDAFMKSAAEKLKSLAKL